MANRDPLPTEIGNCRKWLERQIELICPKIIVTLGRYSMNHFLGEHLKISQEHGKLKLRDGRYFLIMYHPAAALYNGSMRENLLNDFLKIPKALAKIEEEATETSQMTIF